jgi:hypothetical protein
MAVTPIRLAATAFDHRSPAPAPVQPAAAVADATHDGKHHERGAGAQHAHHAHAPGHGPTPRPRRNASAKTSRSRRRRRAGAPVEDDEIELPEAEHHADGVAGVGFQDDHPDSGNDEDEGDRERSRHDRLGRVRRHAAEQALSIEAPPRFARDASVGVEQAVDAFLDASCGLVAAWKPGNRAALGMQRAKLQLLRTASAVVRIDGGGLARVGEHLRSRMPAGGGPCNPTLNLLLPLLVLQLQLARTPDQLDEAIARVQASIWGTGR